MSININLVDKKNPEEDRKRKIKKLRGISLALLFFTAFLAILIFALDYRFSASYVKKQQADLLVELEPYTETSSKIFLLNSKLSISSQALANRKMYNLVSGKILEKKPDSIEIQTYTIDESGLSLKITSSSLKPIDEYLNSLIGLVKTKAISSVVLDSLSSVEGVYTVELKII